MPIFEYRCVNCGESFEQLWLPHEEGTVECPACHGNRVEKLISLGSFHLKGTGWYETDFKKKDKGDSE